jgi:hypothetical protein
LPIRRSEAEEEEARETLEVRQGLLAACTARAGTGAEYEYISADSVLCVFPSTERYRVGEMVEGAGTEERIVLLCDRCSRWWNSTVFRAIESTAHAMDI